MYKIKCDSCNAVSINGHACHETGCHGVMVYSKHGREYFRFRVWSLDVYGNVRDGFEVNDRSECAYVMVPKDFTDKQLIKALKSESLLNKRCHFASFRIGGDEKSVFIDSSKTGEPIYQLEAF